MHHQRITYEQACELIERQNATEVAVIGLAQVFRVGTYYIVLGGASECLLVGFDIND